MSSLTIIRSIPFPTIEGLRGEASASCEKSFVGRRFANSPSSLRTARSAFSGEKSELFANQKQRGMERVISIVTAVLSIAFFVVAFLIAILERLDFIM